MNSCPPFQGGRQGVAEEFISLEKVGQPVDRLIDSTDVVPPEGPYDGPKEFEVTVPLSSYLKDRTQFVPSPESTDMNSGKGGWDKAAVVYFDTRRFVPPGEFEGTPLASSYRKDSAQIVPSPEMRIRFRLY